MLNSYLKRVGAISGPLSKNTSHSGLEVIKKWLIGEPQFRGEELFLAFGLAFHERMCGNYKRKVSEADEILLGDARPSSYRPGMVPNTLKHPIVKRLMLNAIKERKVYVKMNGVKLTMILDLERVRQTGGDYKTTNCTTLEDFVAKAILFGYPRQGKTYLIGAQVKQFYFIGVSKIKPHDIFIFNLADHPEEERYAEQELKFLLYFYKYYGVPIFKS